MTKRRASTTYTQWSLNSIFGRDDMERLRRVMATVGQLLGEASKQETALSALFRWGRRHSPQCNDWLAEVAAGARASQSVPALHIAIQTQNALATEHLAKHSRKREIVAVADAGLFLAVAENDLALGDIFLPHVKVDKARDGRGMSPLMVAARLHSNDVFARLLPCSNRELRDHEGFNALTHAIAVRNAEIFSLLLRDASKKEIVGKIGGGRSAIELAEEVQRDGNVFGRTGWTPFFPHDMLVARLDAVELNAEVDETLAARSGETSASVARGARRL